jgi:diadenylate cyclase
MVELFKLGFISVTLFDLLDIVIVSVLFYWIYKALQDTIAMQVLFGLVILIGLSFVAEAINLRSINWLLRLASDIWIIAFIIIFQQEIRKMIVHLTKNPLARFFVKKTTNYNIDEVVEAVILMSKQHTGALIIFPQTQDVSMSSIDAGIAIDAMVSKELLLAIFNNKAPLHDGAIIINRKMVITTALCILPLSMTRRIGNRLLGTRHRAGLGLTEKIDAVVLIVSEETGNISIAQRGYLEMNISHTSLKEKLDSKLSDEQTTA